MIDLRNEVVHKGRIPTPERARKYAAYVYDIIRTVRGELAAVAPDVVEEVALHVGPFRASRALRSRFPTAPGGGGWVATMLGTVAKGMPDDFETQFKFSRARVELWGLRLPPDAV
jgi:hypothetical protein